MGSGVEVPHRSCRCSNSQLSKSIAWIMAFDKVVGLGKFNNKVLISSRSPHWNMVMIAMLFQLRSHASCWNSATYAEAGRDCCCSVRSFVVTIKVRSLSPNVLLNSSKNWSRSAKSGESFSNSDENQDNVISVSSDPMNPTCVSSIAYLCGWRWKTSRTWLTKSRSFVRSPSNFSSKLTWGSFGACGTGFDAGARTWIGARATWSYSMAFRRLAFSCCSCCSMATTSCIWMLEASPILVVDSRQIVADDNSHKTWNSTRSSKTRSSNTRSEKAGSSNTGSSIDTGRASTTGVDENEGQCPKAFYLYCQDATRKL